MKSGFRVTAVLFLSFSAFAQQAVTISMPGATKPIQGDLYGHWQHVESSLPTEGVALKRAGTNRHKP